MSLIQISHVLCEVGDSKERVEYAGVAPLVSVPTLGLYGSQCIPWSVSHQVRVIDDVSVLWRSYYVL